MSPNIPKATTLHPQILKMLGLPPEQPRDASSGSVSVSETGVCGCVCAGVCGCVCAGVCGGRVQVCAVGMCRCVRWAYAGVCDGCVQVCAVDVSM